MYQIPQHILDDLKCSVCDGYLSSKPLMIKPENQQVCGKCFMIIPTEEKEKCLRQFALESLASVFIFPCRYSKLGCQYNFPWNHERNHENSCTYRYKSYRNSTGSDLLKYHQVYAKNHSNYDLNQNQIPGGYQNLTYLNLHRPVKKDSASELQNNINLSIEGAVFPKPKPDLIYSDPMDEHIYDSLAPIRSSYTDQPRCFNCKGVLGEEVVSCSMGHTSCGNCKGSMCMVCVSIAEKETRSQCKYQQNGCKETLKSEEVNKHQSNCVYREIQCPFEPCKYKNIIEVLKSHITKCHPERVLSSSEVTKTFYNRDELLVIFCYDRVFKLVYYYYKTFVEFFVTYIGPSEEAVDYYYEISLDSTDEFIKKRSKCASWNDSMLEKGVTFDRKNIVLASNNKKISFEVQLKIFQVG